MASGALPPAFPAVRIDGELYWDGGILSNTPIEAIFDDHPRRNSLIFAVHLWNPTGKEPETIWEVLQPHQGHPVFEPNREPHRAPARDPQAAPRHHQAAGVRAGVGEAIRSYQGTGRLRLRHAHARRATLAPRLDNESHTKDIDFTPAGIRARWEAGYADTKRALQRQAWLGEFGSARGRDSARAGARRRTRRRDRARRSALRVSSAEARGRVGALMGVHRHLGASACSYRREFPPRRALPRYVLGGSCPRKCTKATSLRR